LLGTLVDMRVEGVDELAVLHAIDAAFAEIAQIHRLMSFHEGDGDLARLHRARAGAWVRVDTRTREVFGCALKVAAAAQGSFDPTVAAEQVIRGYLPRPESVLTPDPDASWRDIELLDDAVRLHRPLWIDLGGIAKGYAVDRAVDILRAAGASQLCVNAGGDLRIAGPRAERVHVRDAHGQVAAAIDLADAAVASSTSAPAGTMPAHVNGASRRAIDGGVTVAVVAPTCMVADALTKVVLVQGEASDTVLAMFDAEACMFAPGLDAAA
jgi:thiamine biosynthesis lipoprotein